MKDLLLEMKDLRVAFHSKRGTVPVVHGIDLQVYRGETIGLVGESGCGKSVTSLSMMGLIPAGSGNVSGEIRFKGKDLTKEKESVLRQIRGKEIAMIFQDPMSSLDPAFTVGNQLDEAIRFHEKWPAEKVKERSIELLRLVGIPSPEQRYHEYPHQLSGGMRQRVVIAMALACDPQLLIADEPTTALDVTVQAQILDLLKDIKEKLHTSILIITHDLGVVAEMCDRVVVMYAGEIVEEATTIELFDRTAHPYTKGLLNSIPRIHGKKERLYSIEGSVPTPDRMPKGCHFHPRCPYATDQCRVSKPERTEIDPGHFVRCWHADQVLDTGGEAKLG